MELGELLWFETHLDTRDTLILESSDAGQRVLGLIRSGKRERRKIRFATVTAAVCIALFAGFCTAEPLKWRPPYVVFATAAAAAGTWYGLRATGLLEWQSEKLDRIYYEACYMSKNDPPTEIGAILNKMF